MGFLNYLFLLSIFFLMAYVLFKKRHLDVFFVAVLSSFLFSYPLFFGVVGVLGILPSRSIEDEVYITFIILNFSLLLCMVVNDHVASGFSLKKFNLNRGLGFSRFFACFWLFIFVLLVSIHGFYYLFNTPKTIVMQNAGGLYSIVVGLSGLVSTLLFVSGKRLDKIVACLIVVVMVLMSHRSPIVFFVLAVLVSLGVRAQPFSIGARYPLRLSVMLVAAIFGVSLLKPLYSAFNSGGYIGVLQLFATRDFSDLLFGGMEFSSTQYIYNEIVLKDFSSDGMHVIKGALSLFPAPRSLYTTPSSEFNDLFQPTLFPSIDYGMAYNPFGEFYAALGCMGAYAYSIVLPIAIFVFAEMIRRSKSHWIFVLFVSLFFAFYSYRNSLAVTFGLIRNILWPYLLVWLLYFVALAMFKPFSFGGHFVKTYNEK